MSEEKKFKLEICQEENIKPKNEEVLVMNYEDVIFEDDPKFEECIKQDCEEENSDIIIEQSEVQEIGIANKDFKVEEEDLCDIDTKKNILVKFEKEAPDDNREDKTGKKSCEVDAKQDVLIKFKKINEDACRKEKRKKVMTCNSDEKKVTCYHCGFKTAQKRFLQRHIQNVHGSEEEGIYFDCKYCMFKSKYKQALAYHIARFHMDQIQEESPTKTNLKKSCYDIRGMNIMDHCTLDKNDIYNCNHCFFKTPKKDCIFKHSVLHTVGKVEVLQCPKCPEKYTERVLQVHMQKVHNPEGIFECPNCTYTTAWKTNLRRHIKQNKERKNCKPVYKRKSSKMGKKERLRNEGIAVNKERETD